MSEWGDKKTQRKGRGNLPGMMPCIYRGTERVYDVIQKFWEDKVLRNLGKNVGHCSDNTRWALQT